MWANFYFPLPTSQQELETTCSVIEQFLNCSVAATVGCKEGRPPMVRLAQIKNAYGYLCGEGAQQFLAVLPCLGKHYKQKAIDRCVKQRENRVGKGPDADLCNELKNTYDCTVENAVENCGAEAGKFMSVFTEKTHKELKRMVNCDKFLPNKRE